MKHLILFISHFHCLHCSVNHCGFGYHQDTDGMKPRRGDRSSRLKPGHAARDCIVLFIITITILILIDGRADREILHALTLTHHEVSSWSTFKGRLLLSSIGYEKENRKRQQEHIRYMHNPSTNNILLQYSVLW